MNPDHVSSYFSTTTKADKAKAKRRLVKSLISKGHTRRRALQLVRGM